MQIKPSFLFEDSYFFFKRKSFLCKNKKYKKTSGGVVGAARCGKFSLMVNGLGES